MIRQLIKLFIFALVFIPITKATDITEEKYEFNKTGYNKFVKAKGNNWVEYLKHQKQTMQTANDFAKLAIVIQYGDYDDNGTKLFGWSSFTKATADQAKDLTSIYINATVFADYKCLSETKKNQETICLFNNKSLEEKFSILQKTHPYILQKNLFKKLDFKAKDTYNNDRNIIDILSEEELKIFKMQDQTTKSNNDKLKALSQLLSQNNINEIQDVKEKDGDITLTIASKQISQKEALAIYKEEADEMYAQEKINTAKQAWNHDAIAPLSKSDFVLKPKDSLLHKILLEGLHPNTYRIEFSDIQETEKDKSFMEQINLLYPDLKEITIQYQGQITKAILEAILKMKKLETFHFLANLIQGNDNAEKLAILKDFLNAITNTSEYPNMKDIWIDGLNEQLLTNNNGTRQEMKDLQQYIENLTADIFSK